jgi:Tfp pilus assembly protein PilO
MERKAAAQHALRHPAVIASGLSLMLTTALLAAAAALIWEPSRSDNQRAGAEFEAVSAQLRDLKQRMRLAKDYAARSEQVDLLEGKLRQSKTEPEFVRDIEAIVSKSGAKVTQFSSHKAERNGAMNTTVFEFFLTGSYGNMRQFVSELPNLNEFVAIERISLERTDQGVRAYLVLKRRQRLE